MPRMRLKPCAQPGCPELQPESRCAEHRRERWRYERQIGSKATEPRDRPRRKAAVDAHRKTHGDWCPGWGVPAHASADLTADHIDEVSHGGDAYGELQVLCRACNSRKHATRQSKAR